MSFPNLYYKRTVATAKACYICYKPTVTVLATIDTIDFLYTCPIHLTDPGFATRVPEPESKKPVLSSEEIAKVKQEWEEKQRLKDKDKTQEKEGGKVDGDGKNGTDVPPKGAGGKEAEDVQEKVVNAPSRPTHERYVLHRDIYALRTADHRRRRQTAQTKALAPRFPGAPRSPLP